MRDVESESRRRRLELWLLLPLVLFFILLNWILFRLYTVSADLPLSYALFFFGLVNLNVLVFLAIVFFLGRNLVKIYADSKPKMIGRTLKTRLFLAFISFAFIPTCLMFLVSIFYINNSFDRWFAGRAEDTLKNSSELSSYFLAEVRKDTFFVAQKLKEVDLSKEEDVVNAANEIGIDAVELYRFKSKERLEGLNKEKKGFFLPPLSWGEIEKSLVSSKIHSLARKTAQGEWLSTLIVKEKKGEVLVASKILPFTLIDTIESIAVARADYQTSKDFKIPLKSSYLFILITMTLVILAFGGWFSLYMAQSLSKSLFALGSATKRISRGDFKPIKFNTGMDEIEDLVSNFNTMTEELKGTRQSLNQSIKSLKQSSIYRDTLLSQISSGVVSCDNDLKVTLINKRIQKIFSLSPNEVLGERLQDVFPAEMVKFVKDFNEEEDVVHVHEIDIDMGSKKVLPLQVSIASLFGVDHVKMGYIITVEKVELLRENQRVKAWKEVATRVAHEIKNPLTPVKLSAERLQKKFGEQIDDPAFKICTTTIIKQVDIIRDLVNEFNQYARFPKINLKKIKLRPFLEEISSLYKSSHPDISFKLDCAQDLKLAVDEDQFKRVFINLFSNSIEAMKKHEKKITEKRIFVQVQSSTSGKVVLVKVSDTGPGVPKKNWGDVFKSKYTTKENSDGLGLSIVKKIVEDHGGRISISSNEKFASVFLIEMSALTRVAS